MAEDKKSPVQQEQERLQKPLGIKRPLSWVLFAPIVLAFLILPLLAVIFPDTPTHTNSKNNTENSILVKQEAVPLNAHPYLQSQVDDSNRVQTKWSLDSVWNPGPLASAHSNLEGDCQACHAGNFSRVADSSCTSCHSNMGQHVTTQTLPDTSFEEGRCASCHRDHKGRESLAEQNKHFTGQNCADCHSKIKTVAPKTETLPVADFSKDQHPAFRLTVATGIETSDLRRIRMAAKHTIEEPNALKFPHDVHLDPKGIESPGKKVVMTCANCHEPANTPTGFKPLSMEAHCQECHKLNFEPALPDRQVPHGKPEVVLSTIAEFYSHLALHPEDKLQVNAGRAALRARPGQENPNRSTLQNLAGNPQAQAAFAATELFEKTACAVCHEVSRAPGAGNRRTTGSKLPQYTIAELVPAHAWMPMAKFDHKAHEFESCSSCHAAKDSKKSKDVLMPGIQGCQECHSGSKQVVNKVRSDCGLCHEYHLHDKQVNAQSIKSAHP